MLQNSSGMPLNARCVRISAFFHFYFRFWKSQGAKSGEWGEQSNFAIRYFVKIHGTIFSFGQFPNLNTKFDINVLFEQFCERQKKRTCSTNFSREVGAS